VVVPSYNHAPFVEQCLRSVYAQTSPPGRLLVIDDGSTDGSPRLISNVLEECPFPCELIARPNRGLSATLNEGLSRTTGELFAYIGSDDVWHPERLEAGVRALRENPRAVLAYSDCYVIDEDQRIVGSTKDWSSYASGSVFTDLMQVRFVPLSPTVLYRREAIARFGWREDGPLEDYETYLKLAYVGEFAYVPRNLGYWRKHGSNTSRDVSMMLKEALEAQRRVADWCGMPRGELRRHQDRLKFAFAGDILAAGQRWRAAKLSVMHAAGAPSIGVLARRGARLLAPRTLLEKREALLARRSALKRGSL
jgi:alpha-1,3-rhamnosyltransferase